MTHTRCSHYHSPDQILFFYVLGVHWKFVGGGVAATFIIYEVIQAVIINLLIKSASRLQHHDLL
jgi:hypothetical protein